MNVVLVQCNRLQKETGTLVPASYLASVVGDGYIYYNDYEFFRTWIKNDENKYQTEIYYPQHSRWIITTDIESIKLYDYNTGGNLPTGIGVEAACQYAITVANDPAHGYSQLNRTGNPDYDCSSLVYLSFHDGGSFTDLPSYPGTTYSMISDFTNAGFTWHGGMYWRSVDELQRGDILLFEGDINAGTGHTALYLGDYQLVEASCDENGSIEGYWAGDQTGTEIYIHGYYDFPWDGYLRYEGNLQPL